MDDLRDLFDLSDDDEPDEDAYDTVGGFVVHRVGRIPLPGAEIDFRDDVILRVEAAEPRRVAKVIASRPRPSERRARLRSTATSATPDRVQRPDSVSGGAEKIGHFVTEADRFGSRFATRYIG